MKLLKKTNSHAGILAELSQELGSLNEEIIKYDHEIRYIEELLVVTSGPAEDLLEDLNRNQKKRNELNFRYSAVMKQFQELKNAD